MVEQSASMDIAACLQQGLSRPCCSKILNCSWPSLFHKPDAGTSSELVVVLYFAECSGCWRDLNAQQRRFGLRGQYVLSYLLVEDRLLPAIRRCVSYFSRTHSNMGDTYVLPQRRIVRLKFTGTDAGIRRTRWVLLAAWWASFSTPHVLEER